MPNVGLHSTSEVTHCSSLSATATTAAVLTEDRVYETTETTPMTATTVQISHRERSKKRPILNMRLANTHVLEAGLVEGECIERAREDREDQVWT